jgi:photosystem II protein
MTIEIQFIKGLKETTLPIIKLTKSRNGKTGTATFIFLKPTIFEKMIGRSDNIDGMYLVWENKKIITHDISIFFKNGKPFLLKTIFIFKNANEWFNFLNFMNNYSKETGLSFAEKY